MQGHVAASAGRNVTLRSEEWAGCVCMTYNLHHNRSDVGDARLPEYNESGTRRRSCLCESVSYFELIQDFLHF